MGIACCCSPVRAQHGDGKATSHIGGRGVKTRNLAPTCQEFWDFGEAIERFLVSSVQEDVSKWPDLVEIVSDLSPDARTEALDSLLQKTEEFKDQSLGLDIWSKVRFQLHRHRLHPDADWAMAAEEVATLARIYEKLTPSDTISANIWLFAGWVELPNPTGQELDSKDSMATREQLNAAQQEAVLLVYESGGTDAVLRLVEAVANPSDVGFVVGSSMGQDLAISLASSHIGSTSEGLRQFAHAIASTLFHSVGWDPLQRVLAQVRIAGGNPDRVAAVYLCGAANPETWDRLGLEAQETQDAYWRQLPAFRLPRQDPDGMEIWCAAFLEHASLNGPFEDTVAG